MTRIQWVFGAGVTALVVVAIMLTLAPGKTTQHADSAGDVPLEDRAREFPPGSPERHVLDLAGQNNEEAQAQLIEMYGAWAGRDDRNDARREILGTLARVEDPNKALALVLMAVATQESASVDDELLKFAAARIQGFWADPKLFERGRDLLLTERNEARRTVLLTSLVGHSSQSSGVTEAQRLDLSSDLIDLYFRSSEAGVKAQMSDALRRVGGAELADALDEPTIDSKEVRERAAAKEAADIDEALRQLGGDPSAPRDTVPDPRQALDDLVRAAAAP